MYRTFPRYIYTILPQRKYLQCIHIVQTHDTYTHYIQTIMQTMQLIINYYLQMIKCSIGSSTYQVNTEYPEPSLPLLSTEEPALGLSHYNIKQYKL